MARDWKETTSYKLTTEEMENLLIRDFGDRLHPVDKVKLQKQRQQKARYRTGTQEE